MRRALLTRSGFVGTNPGFLILLAPPSSAVYSNKLGDQVRAGFNVWPERKKYHDAALCRNHQKSGQSQRRAGQREKATGVLRLAYHSVAALSKHDNVVAVNGDKSDYSTRHCLQNFSGFQEELNLCKGVGNCLTVGETLKMRGESCPIQSFDIMRPPDLGVVTPGSENKL